MIRVLRALVEHFADQPDAAARSRRRLDVAAGSAEAVRAAVTYVAGMTDRFACEQAVRCSAGRPTPCPAASTCPLSLELNLDGARPRSAGASKHAAGRLPAGRCQAGRTSTSLRPLRRAELHLALGQGEQRVVAAAADVLARVDAGAALADDDRAGGARRCRRSAFTPRRLLWESRPLRVEPPPLVFDMARSALRDAGDLDRGVRAGGGPSGVRWFDLFL